MVVSFLKQSWLILMLAVGAGVGLAAVQRSLDGRIEANRQAKTQRAACEVVGVDPAGGRIEPMAVDPSDGRIKPVAVDPSDGQIKANGRPVREDEIFYRVHGAGGRPAGWAVPARTEQGYGGRIELMVGLDPAGAKITGLQVIAANETPGLGDNIRGQWAGQFAGKPADRSLTVVKGREASGPEIEAITGATISSEAVTGAVNAMLGRVRGAIAERAAETAGGGGPGGPALETPTTGGGR